jgi:hypothetical protein
MTLVHFNGEEEGSDGNDSFEEEGGFVLLKR